MDNRPDLKQYYGNKANWKKKKVKRQHSSCSSAHENQKEVSVVRFFFHLHYLKVR
jgi:hypothetical protein